MLDVWRHLLTVPDDEVRGRARLHAAHTGARRQMWAPRAVLELSSEAR